MQCSECGASIKLSKYKLQCSYTKRVVDIKTEQPKWCNDGHKTSELDEGIIVDDL